MGSYGSIRWSARHPSLGRQVLEAGREASRGGVAKPLARELAKPGELFPTEEAGDRGFSGKFEVTLQFGGERPVIPTRAVKGTRRDPFTWDNGVAKSDQFTGRILSDRRAAELIEAVRGITEIFDMATVARMTGAQATERLKLTGEYHRGPKPCGQPDSVSLRARPPISARGTSRIGRYHTSKGPGYQWPGRLVTAGVF